MVEHTLRGAAAPTTSQPHRRAARALQGSGAVGGLSQSLAGVTGALLARDVTGGDAAAGWPQAALVAGSALAAVGLARLTRAYGRRIALATGALTAVLGSLLVVASGVVGSLSGILLGSVLLGAGNTTVMLGRYAAAEVAVPAARARAMGWVLAATSVGAVAGPNLMGPSGRLAEALGLPLFTGPYVVAAAGFATSWLLLVGGLRGAFERPVDASSRVAPAGGRATGPAGITAVAALACANLVMVTVMTMAPVHLHDHGTHLGGIGLVVSIHIAGMFVPSPVSGWLTDRLGPPPVLAASGVVLALGCALAATGDDSTAVLLTGLTLLGVGWNLTLVAGSTWLTAGVDQAHRPMREGLGEVGMGTAAALGGVFSGVVVGVAGFATLAASAAVVSLLLVLPACTRPRPSPGAAGAVFITGPPRAATTREDPSRCPPF